MSDKEVSKCLRCNHPASWHRLNDALNIPPTSPDAKFRCIGYDCERPGKPVQNGCDCPDFESRVVPVEAVPTRFEDFDDETHPFRKWWNEHGQFMLSGGGRRESIWAARGWIAREQLGFGAKVTGDSMHEKAEPGAEVRETREQALGTMDCPICGLNSPHSHSPAEICVWLEAQASRFGLKVRIFDSATAQMTIAQFESGLGQYAEWSERVSKLGYSILMEHGSDKTWKIESQYLSRFGPTFYIGWKAFELGRNFRESECSSLIREREQLKIAGRNLVEACKLSGSSEFAAALASFVRELEGR